ncbi:MAG TPA: hypothetical protein VL334_19610 [Anaerolineae bacterium]|nr:hypothetical protein [Anaerolineae bacterium]
MSIIINEFEIVAPPPGATDGDNTRSQGRTGPGGDQSVSTVQPAEVEEILRRSLQRRLRVWAD